jgi:hypothetical protein
MSNMYIENIHCVYTQGKVDKYALCNIFRVTEEYQ